MKKRYTFEILLKFLKNNFPKKRMCNLSNLETEDYYFNNLSLQFLKSQKLMTSKPLEY